MIKFYAFTYWVKSFKHIPRHFYCFHLTSLILYIGFEVITIFFLTFAFFTYFLEVLLNIFFNQFLGVIMKNLIRSFIFFVPLFIFTVVLQSCSSENSITSAIPPPPDKQ